MHLDDLILFHMGLEMMLLQEYKGGDYYGQHYQTFKTCILDENFRLLSLQTFDVCQKQSNMLLLLNKYQQAEVKVVTNNTSYAGLMVNLQVLGGLDFEDRNLSKGWCSCDVHSNPIKLLSSTLDSKVFTLNFLKL